MIYNQIINFPIIIKQIDIETTKLDSVLLENNLIFKKVLVLTGSGYSLGIAKKFIQDSSIDYLLVDNVTNSLELVESMSCDIAGIDLVIGIGGGKVLDTAKYLASKNMINYMAFPTVISNDGIVSPISILKSGTKVQSYGTKIPMGVIYDINIIKKSSREYFVSGIGDIVSNYTALLDWELAISCNKDSGNDFAQMLSKMSLDSLINIEFDIDSQKFINSFVYAVIISGLSMNIAGSSRPCSGAEHLIAHAIDNLNLTSYSHGFLVGSATMYVSFLHDRFDLGIFKYIEQVGLNCDFMSFLDIEFCELIDRAKVIRGDRFTILNKYSNKELEIRYNKFLNMIKEIK